MLIYSPLLFTFMFVFSVNFIYICIPIRYKYYFLILVVEYLLINRTFSVNYQLITC